MTFTPIGTQGEQPQDAAAGNGGEVGESASTVNDFEELRIFGSQLAQLTPRVFVTKLILVVNFVIFLLMAAQSKSLLSLPPELVLKWGANYGPRTTDGEYFRLFSSMFLHFGLLHVALNMWALWAAGRLVERLVGNLGFLLLYCLAGIMGSVASLLWNPMLVSAGASGAVFGVFGGLLGILWKRHDSVPKIVIERLRSSGMKFLGLNLFLGFMISNIDSAAHVGGLLGGMVGGALLSLPFTRQGIANRSYRNASFACAATVIVIAGILAVSVKYPQLDDIYFGKVERSNIEVYYSKGVSKEDATKLVGFLAKNWPAAPTKRSLSLQKATDRLKVLMVVKKEARNDPKTIRDFAFLASQFSHEVFEGQAVEIHACDENFKTIQTIGQRPDLRYCIESGHAQVWFGDTENRALAQRLARFLEQLTNEATSKISFKYHEAGNNLELSMVCNEQALKDPKFEDAIRETAHSISNGVFNGRKLKFHLCDTEFNVVKTVER